MQLLKQPHCSSVTSNLIWQAAVAHCVTTGSNLVKADSLLRARAKLHVRLRSDAKPSHDLCRPCDTGCATQIPVFTDKACRPRKYQCAWDDLDEFCLVISR